MSDAILVLNAGSSSLKFSAFGPRGAGIRGPTGPRTGGRDRHRRGSASAVLAARSSRSTPRKPGRYSTTNRPWGCVRTVPGKRSAATVSSLSGNWSSTAGCGSRRRCGSMVPCWPSSTPWCRSPRCTSRTTWRRSGRCADWRRTSWHVSRVSTRRSTAPSRNRATVRPAPTVHRRGRAAIRISRPVIRVRRVGAGPASTPVLRGRANGRRAPRERREHVRHARRAERRDDDELFMHPPYDGLLMGTRVGSLDPGVMLYLMARHGMSRGRS